MEGKKVLWVVFSIALALVVVLAAGLFLLRPRQPKSPEASGMAAPSLQGYDPYEYVRGASAPPGLTAPPAESQPQPTVIVVGEAPAGGAPVAGEGVAGGAPAAGEEPLVPAIEPLGPAVETPPAAQAVAPAAPAVTAAPAPVVEKPASAAKPAGGPAKAAPKAAPAPRPRAVSVTEYWIQAGSFSSASRADEVTRRLEERGLAARTTTRDLNGRTHFRVRVGPYTSRDEAEKFLGWIRELKGFETSYISMVASRRTMP